jgi:tight adherence protein C
MPTKRERQSALRRQLGYAGIYSPAAIRTLAGCKVLLLAGGLFGGYLLGLAMEQLLLGLSVGGLVGYLLPTFWLGQKIKAQRNAIEEGLPDALDLLVVCVEAGLTVDAAMQRVGQELALAHASLARELEITHMETRVGVARSDAMKNLASRTGSRALGTLATMLIQAERFGTSIAHSLRIHAESLRTARQHRAEEMAAKASVKLSFPVVLFIFPAVLIVLAGPAVIGFMKSSLFTQ